jgi:hypothetical protein
LTKKLAIHRLSKPVEAFDPLPVKPLEFLADIQNRRDAPLHLQWGERDWESFQLAHVYRSYSSSLLRLAKKISFSVGARYQMSQVLHVNML